MTIRTVVVARAACTSLGVLLMGANVGNRSHLRRGEGMVKVKTAPRTAAVLAPSLIPGLTRSPPWPSTSAPHQPEQLHSAPLLVRDLLLLLVTSPIRQVWIPSRSHCGRPRRGHGHVTSVTPARTTGELPSSVRAPHVIRLGSSLCAILVLALPRAPVALNARSPDPAPMLGGVGEQ